MPAPHRLTPLGKALLLRHALRPSLSMSALGLALALPYATVAQAQDLAFDIPAQPLSSALLSFGKQTDMQILFSQDTVQGRRSAAVAGRLSPEQALARLLQGTGVSYSVQGNVVTLGAPRAADDAAMQLGATNISGAALGITTEGTGSYTTGETAAATRLPLSLRKTPQSVSVVTRQQMDDQNLQSVSDVLTQTPGITVDQESSEAYSFYSRGFKLENFQFDGVPSLSSEGGSLRDNYSIGDSLIYDRVEVLKGATGLVNGTGYPSGVVNLVRKRPTDKFQGKVGLGAGSWDKYTADIDLSGPLTDSGNIRGRTVVGTQKQHSYVNYLTGEQNTFYGVLEADLNESTMLSVGYDIQKNNNNGSTVNAMPGFYQDGRIAKFDRDFNAADRWSWRNQETQRAFVELSHTFDNDWILKGVASGRQYRSRELMSGVSAEGIRDDGRISHGFIGGNINPDGTVNTAFGTASKFNTTSKEKGLDLYARGPFTLGGRIHEAVVGYNYSETKSQSVRQDGQTNPIVEDVFQWDGYGDYPTNFQWWSTFDIKARQSVAFAASIFKPTDELSLIVGARVVNYTWEIDTINAVNRKLPADSKVSGEVVPYAGVTYDLDQYHTVYFSYTDVFKPQAYNRDATGKPLDPMTGKSYEIGIKGAYLEDRVNASLAVFQLSQDNFAVEVGYDAQNFRSIYEAREGVKTRGVELEVSGEVLKDLNVMGGYTFAESHDSDDERVATNQPQHLLKLATNYRLPGDWSKITVGGNLKWQSETFYQPGEWYTTDDPNAKFKQKAFTLVGLNAGYDFTRDLKGTVNVNNLFDKHYYSGLGNYDSVYWGAPRNVMFNVKYSF